MAWDGIAWIKLNRPLTEEEKSRRLRIDVAASNNPQDDFSVFAMNDVFLESTNAQFQRRGMLTYGGIFILPLGLFLTYIMIRMVTHIPPSMPRDASLAVVIACLCALEAVVLGGMGFVVWAMLQENFSWTRFPVRFNRRTRMVHAYRGAGAKGVISVPWEKAFFFVEPRKKDPLSRTNSFNIRCHVLDNAGNVQQSFSVGSSVTSLSAESTEAGAKIVGELADQFEFIRRYMEDGPSAVPSPEVVPTNVSLSNSLKIWLRSDKKFLASRNPIAMLGLLLSPFAAFTGLLHYIGQLTSQQPVWPEEIERECELGRGEPAKI
ncbi:hypothetical protein EN871_27855 [bacterium M00.F.Ca.ET.228.01.1.1]|uniref:DUF6708 domain-containing protein n=1 Tax=Paraburkholderia phenoliruptrix TaxID=252970 RepID=UPI001092D1EE|nr:DUF6708 domain-containing protein [Paraburkholderia phenoliruptrix]TGP40577.1 hypothetical protein EN871_27855 [bacterium M00.F.Ca.ET.228.01.1.1]TGR96678.1 hypothetical protein EN834_27135 [bacterium M00.F.Ca.ET.191.01.1.1]TGT97945.1 hypothetical protein EN798_27140 [bacterium M00.F.Ca.ET.155.01.1.1]MBW0446000.1 hypothetical protein [Paraburkholderia phenoliruptrix]MBW9100002.1 hypothetical protein [Paraburkholderia phenoliruptrix]